MLSCLRVPVLTTAPFKYLDLVTPIFIDRLKSPLSTGALDIAKFLTGSIAVFTASVINLPLTLRLMLSSLAFNCAAPFTL